MGRLPGRPTGLRRVREGGPPRLAHLKPRLAVAASLRSHADDALGRAGVAVPLRSQERAELGGPQKPALVLRQRC